MATNGDVKPEERRAVTSGKPDKITRAKETTLES